MNEIKVQVSFDNQPRLVRLTTMTDSLHTDSEKAGAAHLGAAIATGDEDVLNRMGYKQELKFVSASSSCLACSAYLCHP
jgi:hypothetical protein